MGCVNTATSTVTVNQLPTVVISASSPICPNVNYTMTASGASSYAWSLNGSPFGTWNPLYVSTGSSGDNTYSVTGTNTANCSATASKVITVNPKPVITITPNSPTICFGNTATLTAGGASSYVWSNLLATSSIAVSPAASMSYTVTGTSAAGCSSTATTFVTVNSKPTLTVSPSSSTICLGNTTTLSVGGALSYVWNNASILPTISVTPIMTTSYTVTGINALGCTNTATSIVTVNSLPTVTVSPANAAICSGSYLTLTGGGATSYTWNFASTGILWGTGTSMSNNFYTGTTPTIFNYTVTGKNPSGCLNTINGTFTINPVPLVTVTPTSATICSGTNTTLSASGASSYKWNTGDASTTISVLPATTNSYSVTGVNNYGCSNVATSSIIVNPTPTVTVSPLNAVICSGSYLTLNASGATSYTWNFASTGILWGTGPSISNNYYSYSTPSVFNYTVTGKNSSGCLKTINGTFTVNPLPTVYVSPTSSTICSGTSKILSAGGASSYKWNTSDISTAITVLPTTTNVYIVTGTNNYGCSSQATSAVNVSISPTIIVSPANATICSGSYLALNASGATSYTWNYASTGILWGTGSSISDFFYTGSTPTNFNYTVTGKNTLGCSKTINGTFTINPLPIVTNVSSAGGFDASSFGANGTYATGGMPCYAVTGDIDGDGLSDVAVTNLGANSISVFHNTSSAGSISMAEQVQYVTGANPTSVSMGDLDGDGLSDLAIANMSVDMVSILLNNSTPGTISFSKQVINLTLPYQSNPRSVYIGDLDGDGLSDLVVTQYGPSSTGVFLMSVYRNTSVKGSISFAPRIDYKTENYPIDVKCGDLNGDGKPELIVANYGTGSLSVFTNTSVKGTISFSSNILKIQSGIISPTSIALGDMDRDGLLDIVITDLDLRSVTIFKMANTNSIISVSKTVSLPTGWRPENVSLSDLDNDGNLDIVVTNSGFSYDPSTNSVSIIKNTGSLTFAPKFDFATGPLTDIGSDPQGVSISDFNNDGKMDIVYTNSNAKTIAILKNAIVRYTIGTGGTLNIPLTSNVPSTFTWIATDNVNTTGESLTTKSSNTITDVITNNSTADQTITYKVTPTSILTGCTGDPQTIIVTVRPYKLKRDVVESIDNTIVTQESIVDPNLDITNASTLSIAPQPASNEIRIISSSIVKKVTIININGVTVKTAQAESILDISTLSAGIYQAIIETESGVYSKTISVVK